MGYADIQSEPSTRSRTRGLLLTPRVPLPRSCHGREDSWCPRSGDDVPTFALGQALSDAVGVEHEVFGTAHFHGTSASLESFAWRVMMEEASKRLALAEILSHALSFWCQ